MATARRWCALALASLLSTPADAGAESGVDACRVTCCGYDGSVHSDPPAGDVPANQPRFVVLMHGVVDPTEVRLVRQSDGVEVGVERVWTHDGGYRDGVAVLPSETLVVGETYELSHPTCSATPPESTLYAVVAPVDPTPSALGAVTVSPLFASYLGYGAANLRFYVRVTLVPDASFAPWIATGLYEWTPEVAGRREWWTPRFDLAVAVGVHCGVRADDLEPGTVAFSGAADVAPRRGALLATPAVDADLACAGATIVDGASLRPLTPAEIAFWNAPAMDAGTTSMDAGAGAADGAAHTEPDTRGTCAATGRGRAAAPSAIVVVFGLLALRAYRRGFTRRAF